MLATRNETAARGHIPGEPGLWVLVLGDLFVFGLFFGTIAYYRLGEPALFAASQARLDQLSGLVNTLLLLTSSWCIVQALHAARRGDRRAAPRWTGFAMVLGVGFVAIKANEYGHKVAAGLLPTTNDFFMLYFVFTGIHLVHVLVGLAVLALVRRGVARPLTAPQLKLVEGAAVFWHMVDILWVILFALFYLVR